MSVVLLGDFNCECNVQYSGYRLLSTLLRDYNLKCCEPLADPPNEYTYFQETMCRFFIDRSHVCNLQFV